MKFIGSVIGSVIVTIVIVPLAMLLGVIFLPLKKAKEEWQKGAVGSALLYGVVANWPMWAILAVLIFAS